MIMIKLVLFYILQTVKSSDNTKTNNNILAGYAILMTSLIYL